MCSTKMGATLIDGLDTLIIMGLNEEVAHAREWIATSLEFDVVCYSVAVALQRGKGSVFRRNSMRPRSLVPVS